jgi:hypothetical protein
VKDIRAVVELTFDPGPSEAGERLVRALAERTRAVVLRTNGSLSGPDGSLWIPPRPAPADADDIDIDEEEGDDDGDGDGEPPSPERVARRALVVLSLAWRANLEHERLLDAGRRFPRPRR